MTYKLIMIVMAPREIRLSLLHLKRLVFRNSKNTLLEPGLVDHIVIANKSVAKVYVRNSPNNSTQSESSDVEIHVRRTSSEGGSQHKYSFNIDNVEPFEQKLEDAEEALGIGPHDYVPVTYVSERSGTKSC